MGSFSDLKGKLITACRILDKEGIMDELGHFSVRCPEKGGVLINGSVSPGQAREEDLIVVDLEGKRLEGNLEPASEVPLHLAVYQKRRDVMAIAHTHSPMVVTLSIAGISIRTVENQGASIIEARAPLFEKYGLVNSLEIGYEVAETMGSQNICVLKSHGNIVVGANIEEVCVWSIWAEKAARYQYQAMLLGTPHWYPEGELQKVRKQVRKGKAHTRTWHYYKWKLNQ